MRRLLSIAILAAGAVLGTQAFALAGDGPPAKAADPGPAPHRAVSTAPAPSPTAAEPTTTTTGGAAALGAAVAVADIAPDRPVDPPVRFEELRLRCAAAATDAGRGVGCQWSQSAHPRFAGYRLVRSDGEHREVVFRTHEVEVVRHLDTTVTPGVRYRYAVEVLDAHGRVIGRAGPVTAGVPEPEPQDLRFGCERASDGDVRGITCRWVGAEGAVRGYVLYRSVDGGAREAIYRTGPDGRLGHVDGPLRPGHRYTYAVVALDGAGEVVGIGGPVTIGIPPPDPATTDAARRG